MPSTATDRLNGLTTSVAVKPPCITVALSNITLSGLQTVTGVTVVEGDRVLVTAQSDASENGIYNASTGDWIRAKDFDGNRDVVQGTIVLVRSGSADGAIFEVTTANPIVIGTSNIVFELRDDPSLTYAQTAAELAAGVTPTNYAYEPYTSPRYLLGDGSDETALIEDVVGAAASVGAKFIFKKTADGFGISGNLALTGEIEFEDGAFFVCLGEALITADGDLTATNFMVDADDQTVTGHLLYLTSGNHKLVKPKIINIKGTGAGAYAIKINVEGAGKRTIIEAPYFEQITDARDGAISGLEGFCGGIYITTDTGSTMMADGRTIIIKDCYGKDIYTTQADGTTENSSDYDADLIRAFVNDATSEAYINSVNILIQNTEAHDVQKRAIKLSGIGNAVIENTVGYGTRAAVQMSDIVFVADCRNVDISSTKGFQKFDNVVKLDGSTFGAVYCVNDTVAVSSQAALGCAIFASDLVNLTVRGVRSQTDLERLIRFNGVDRFSITGLVYNGTKTSIEALLDVQNCDDFTIHGVVNSVQSGASGKNVYFIGCNRGILDGDFVASFGTAGENIRWEDCVDLQIRGHNKSNAYNLYGEATSSKVHVYQTIEHTGNNGANPLIDVSGTDDFHLHCPSFRATLTGVNVTAGVIKINDADLFSIAGVFNMLGMTSASADLGIALTSCTRGNIDINTFGGGADAVMLYLASCSKVFVKSISDSTKPVQFATGCTDVVVISAAPDGIINDVSTELTVISEIDTW